MKNEELKKVILEHFESETEAAEAMGWSKQRLNKLTSGKKRADIEDVKAISRATGKSAGEIIALFI